MAEADRDKWNDRYRSGAYADRRHPSALLERWIERIPPGRALDLACGSGRNALFLARRGFEVDAVDISNEALARARDRARGAGLKVNWIEHDLDQPLALGAEYALILVVRFMNLPLIAGLSARLAPGGFLIVEQHLVTTAEVAEAQIAGPADPAFRVKPGELQQLAQSLRVLCYEEALTLDPDQRQVALARLVAQKAAQKAA
jgi:SAM-dependent methyltransferase